METWFTVVIVAHVLVAVAIIGLVLLQHGKGADMGSGFGGGASGSLFGATGSANFLSRMTAALATVFFLTSLGLAYFATHRPKEGGTVMQGVKTDSQPALKPAAPDADRTKTVPLEGAGAPAKSEPKPKDVPN